jgi:uncharacterized protein (TIGR03083 family)
MIEDRHPGDLVGPYAIEACAPDEARSVAEHASHCPACWSEIAELSRVVEWIGVSAATAPAHDLRSRVLAAALAARPSAGSTDSLAGGDIDAVVHRLLESYRMQVKELDRLLSGLSQAQWLVPTGPHRSVRDLVVHLSGNDGLVAVAAGLAPPELDSRSSASDARLGWREQAHAIIGVVDRREPRLLQQQVGLAGHAAIRRPLSEALIQRGFETWIHAEDIRAVLGRPAQTPGAQQMSDIVDFALRLLPAAMDASGRGHPSEAIRVVLTGAGGGTRLVNLSAVGPFPGTVVAEVSLPAERFCRLLAGRLVASSANGQVSGDFRAVHDFLTVAATMGCD